MLPYWKGEKLMGKFSNRIKFDDISKLEFYYNEMHDKAVYEVNYCYGMTWKLAGNIIAENILS